MNVTAPMLFAGPEHRPGEHRCYYCGADCDDTHLTKTQVRDTFTNRDIVKFPASDHVCQGCVMSIGAGTGDLPMIDGTVKAFTTPKGMAARMYSWLLSADGNRAFTKAHIAEIREILTDQANLPEPPFAVILSDTGQKQLIFRAPVARSKDAFSVMLEDVAIPMTPAGLKSRLELAGAISTKLGKPLLSAGVNFGMWTKAEKAGLLDELAEWLKIQHEPLSRLAAWLAPAKTKE